MAPEQDARSGAFYDHESNESAPRRRRAAADWGVGEDIFDRMPSRRLTRADRRAEHHEDLESHRFERRVSGPAAERGVETFAPRNDDWGDAHERRQVAPRRDDWAPAPAENAARHAARRVLDRGRRAPSPSRASARSIRGWSPSAAMSSRSRPARAGRSCSRRAAAGARARSRAAGAPHGRDQRPPRPAAGRAHAASAADRRRAHRRAPGPDRRLRRAAGFPARPDRDSHDRPINRGASPCGAPRADIPLSLVSSPPAPPRWWQCPRQR